MKPIELNTSPRPWRIDQDNDGGISIVADNGDVVALESFSAAWALDARVRKEVIKTTRSNFYKIVDAVNAYPLHSWREQ